MFPWIDYSGRFSPLRAVVLLSLFVPVGCTIYWMQTHQLGARPLTEAIHEVGLWTIRFIFIALAISPARRILAWPKLLEVRRMVGVAAFAYVCMHLLLYITDEAFDLRLVASEIVLRIYLTIGFTALIGLAVLAATSNDTMVRRLGGRRWQRLHRVVYVIAVLAIIHYFMQSKEAEYEPTWMAGVFGWLMGWRLLDWMAPRGKTAPLWQVWVLCPVAAILTALGEALYYWIVVHAPIERVLMANLSFVIGPRPAWIVLGASVALTLLGTLRRLIRPSAPSPERSRASAARGA